MSEFLEIRSGWSEDLLYQDVAAAGPLVVASLFSPGL